MIVINNIQSKSKHINVTRNFAIIKSYFTKTFKTPVGKTVSSVSDIGSAGHAMSGMAQGEAELLQTSTITIAEYEITFGVDLLFALYKNAYKVKITALNNNVEISGDIFSIQQGTVSGQETLDTYESDAHNISPGQLVNNILTNFAKKINNKVHEQPEGILVNKNVDLTTKINNDFIDLIRKDLYPLAGVSIIPSDSHKIFSSIKQQNIITRKIISPVKVWKTDESSEKIFNLTPPVILSKIFPNPNAITNIEKNRPPLNIGDGTPLLDTISNLGASIPSNNAAEMYAGKVTFGRVEDIDNEKFLPKVEFKGTNIAEFKTKLRIAGVKHGNSTFEKNKPIPDKIILKFDLLDTHNNIVSTNKRPLDHNKQVKFYLTPKTKPNVKIAHYAKNVILSIKQNDLNATGVKIYKKIIKNYDNLSDTFFSNFTHIKNITSDMGIMKISDTVPESRSVVYRIIPTYGQKIGNIYTDVTTGIILNNIPINDNKTKCRIFLGSLRNGIQIQVSSVPRGVIAINILRRNVTHKRKDFIFVTNDLASSNIAYFDSDVEHGKVYEYTCDLIYSSGSIIRSSTRQMIEYTKVSNMEVEISAEITNKSFKYVNGQSRPDITIKISEIIKDKPLSILKTALNKSGIENFYFEELKDEKDVIEQLIFHRIQRINRTTGHISELGMSPGGQFNDSEQSAKTGSQALTMGNKYTYRIFSYFRVPEQIIPGSIKTHRANVPNKKYNVNVFKYFNGLTETNGTLITEDSFKSQHGKDMITLGYPINIIDVSTEFSEARPTIKSASVKIIGDGYTEIKWSVKGKCRKIDSFVITMIKNNSAVNIGTVHAIGSGNTFIFYHNTKPESIKYKLNTNLFRLTDTVQYVIQPIYHDYDIGESVKTKRIEV